MDKAYKTITKIVGYLDADFFDSSVKDLIKELEKLHEVYPGYDDFIIHDMNTPDAYSGYDLLGTRKETDEERDKRLAKAKKARISQKKRREREAKAKEERELKTYARLKAKFEKEKK